MRKALVGLLYRKMLRLSNQSLSATSSGRLISLSSGDMAFIQSSSNALISGAVSPFVAIAVFLIAYHIVSHFLNLGG